MGAWVGNARDIRSRARPQDEPPEKVGPYTIWLDVYGQEGPRFVGHLLFDEEAALFWNDDADRPWRCRVAGYITGDGEITMSGGLEREEDGGLHIRITVKAKLYENPERSIRGSWQAFQWQENSWDDEVYSGSFVVSPMRPQTDQ